MSSSSPGSTSLPAAPLSLDSVIAVMSRLLGEGKHENGWTAICAEERVRVDVRGGVVVVEISGPDPGPMRFVEVHSRGQLELLMSYLRHKCIPVPE